jgi:DNA-binding GntR family transcriptional regulator
VGATSHLLFREAKARRTANNDLHHRGSKYNILYVRRLRIPRNLTSLAQENIRGHILQGNLDHDCRLTEEYLSQRLGISKSPIREALNRLEAEGLIRIEPRRGAYLRTFSESEVADLYDFREALEVHSVLMAKLTPNLIEQLKRSVENLERRRRAEARGPYITEDIRFHSTIAQATGNQLLLQALENLHNKLILLRSKSYDLSSSRAVPLHARITSSLENDNREGAAEAMRQHIRSTRDKLIEFVARTAPTRTATERPVAEVDPVQASKG